MEKRARRVARIEQPTELIEGVDHTADWTEQLGELSASPEAARTADWTQLAAGAEKPSPERTADWSEMEDGTATQRVRPERTLDWNELLGE